MCHARKFLQIYLRINLHITEWIKILHRHIQFLRKKLRRVRHDARAAGQEQSLRCRTALLAAIKLHGLIDLNMQLGHELPGNLRNCSLMWIFRFLVSSSKADKTFSNLDFFRLIKF